jgi:hypothetical protein
MKATVLLALFFALRHLVWILEGQPGHVNYWLIILHVLIVSLVLKMPFKLELKLLWTVLFLADCLAPLDASMSVRYLALALIAFWLTSFVYRIAIKSPSATTTWKPSGE